MSKGKHTPLPWEHVGYGTIWPVSGEGSYPVAETFAHGSGKIKEDTIEFQNAEFIVKACNSHYEMLEALEHVLSGLEAWVEITDDDDKRDSDNEAIWEARAVILKAKRGLQ